MKLSTLETFVKRAKELDFSGESKVNAWPTYSGETEFSVVTEHLKITMRTVKEGSGYDEIVISRYEQEKFT